MKHGLVFLTLEKAKRPLDGRLNLIYVGDAAE